MTYEQILERAVEKKRIDIQKEHEALDGCFIKKSAPGHTWAVAKADSVHTVTSTAVYLSNALFLGEISEEKALEITNGIAKMQITGTGTRQDGNYLWYSEETTIQDYNCAFFVTMPILKLLFCAPEKIFPSQLPIIEKMFKNSLVWFDDYCRSAEMYYPNPTISNAVCYYGIGARFGVPEAVEKARAFLNYYFDYNEKRGWGWGESISPSYIMEIVPPLKLAAIIAKSLGDTELEKRALGLMEGLFDFFRYHGDLEPVPAIRNYNVMGAYKVSRGIKGIIGVTADPKEFDIPMIDLLMFRDEVERFDENAERCRELQKIKVYQKKIFDEHYSYSHRGKGVNLGTISQYPLIPGCYQNPTWGNGWQAMPVCFVVDGAGLSYLRWRVTTKDRRRCFPHEERLRPNDVNAALFNERWYPDMYTFAKQNENIAVVMRRINNIHNSAREIIDEFAVPRFKGEIDKFEVNGIQWAALRYPNNTVFLGALHGFTVRKKEEVAPAAEGEKPQSIMGIFDDVGDLIREPNRRLQDIELSEYYVSNGKINGIYSDIKSQDVKMNTVSQVIYRGEEQVLNFRGLETSWAIITLDERIEDPKAYLETEVKVKLESIADMQTYRLKDALINRISLTADGKSVTLEIDPYDLKCWS